jgi:hypothetical protein
MPRSAWGLVVGASSLLLIAALLALAVSWIASAETRVSTYSVTGSLTGVQLDVRSGNVEVIGGGSAAVEVRRTERFSYGHSSDERRSVAGGVLQVSSSCPSVVLGSCSADYRLTVPDNVPVTIRTGDGDIHLAGFRGSASLTSGAGNVSADAFCGFALSIKTGSGNARANTACSPQRLELRSGSGDIEAIVPTGRYQVDAAAGSGGLQVRGIQRAADAPFSVRAISRSGDVDVRGAP